MPDGSQKFRSGASKENMFPPEHRGCLDKDMPTKLGLDLKRMLDEDALFVYQLLLSICNPSRSGAQGDPRMAFYNDVEKYTGHYAIDMERNLSYGRIKPITAANLIAFHGILVRDGVRGGSKGAIYRR